MQTDRVRKEDFHLRGTNSAVCFGECLESTGTLPTDQLFTGQRRDIATTGSELYYYNARYYDPNIGRFISPDTIVQDLFNPQFLNRYSYCLNNPLKYIDSTGHFVFLLFLGIPVYTWIAAGGAIAALIIFENWVNSHPINISLPEIRRNDNTYNPKYNEPIPQPMPQEGFRATEGEPVPPPGPNPGKGGIAQKVATGVIVAGTLAGAAKGGIEVAEAMEEPSSELPKAPNSTPSTDPPTSAPPPVIVYSGNTASPSNSTITEFFPYNPVVVPNPGGPSPVLDSSGNYTGFYNWGNGSADSPVISMNDPSSYSYSDWY